MGGRRRVGVERVRPVTREEDRRANTVACVLLVVFAAIAWLTSGCAGTTRYTAIDITASTVGAAADVIHETAGAEARQCDHAPACLDALAIRWAPADTAINTAAAALGLWLTAEVLGAGDLNAAMTEALRLVADLPALLARYGVSL